MGSAAVPVAVEIDPKMWERMKRLPARRQHSEH